MSVGPMGMAGSAAGSHLAQKHGSDVNRVQHETSDQGRELRAAEKAENAAGVGQTEQDEEASDRDADGRRLWERTEGSSQDEGIQAHVAASDSAPRGKDASGERGRHVDLSG